MLENSAVSLKIVAWAWVVMAALHLGAQQASPAGTAPAGFQISGILVDANTSQPVPRARVAIASVTQRDNPTTVITGGEGRFSFANLGPGKYTLTAQARGYLAQSFNQHEQFSSSVAVGPNLDSSNLIFRLPPEGSISGVVIDEAGEAVRDAEVLLYVIGSSGGEQAVRSRGRTTTDDEGAYHFGHLAPGRYLVAVVTRPWYAQNQPRGGTAANAEETALDPRLDVAYPVTFNGSATDSGAAAPLVLGRGDNVTADITLQPVQALHVRVPRDNPEQGGYAAIELRLFDGPLAVQMVQIRTFRPGRDDLISVAPGHYTIKHFPPNGAGVGELSRDVDISTSGELDDSQGTSYVPVRGKMQLDPGTAQGQVSLQLLNKKSKQVATERVGSDGEVVFKQGMAPGSYEVSLSSSSGVYVKSISATGATTKGRTVEIRPGNAVKLVISATTGEGEIKGTAQREGKPVGGAMIVLVPADPVHNQVLFRRDQSDTDGTFTISAVVPGAYTLLAIENGWDLEWTRPEVLRNYLAAGAALQVQANGKYDVKVPVQ
jgi:hypothetical protein